MDLSVLEQIDLMIDALCLEQLRVGASFDNLTFVKNQYQISILDGGQSVGDRKGRPSSSHHIERLLDFLFRFRVDVCRRLVENQNLRFDGDCSGKREQLSFTA